MVPAKHGVFKLSLNWITQHQRDPFSVLRCGGVVRPRLSSRSFILITTALAPRMG